MSISNYFHELFKHIDKCVCHNINLSKLFMMPPKLCNFNTKTLTINIVANFLSML